MSERQLNNMKILDDLKKSNSVEYLRFVAVLPCFIPNRSYESIGGEVAEIRGRFDVIENNIAR